MAQAPQVALVGLNALRRDLGRLTANTGALNQAFVKAGTSVAEPVAAAARASLPQVSGRLAKTVRVRKMRSGAGVAMGSASARYAGWVEFGGTRRAPHASSRDYEPLGRYLFPAGLSMAGAGAGAYSTALNAALDSFNWTNETNDPTAVRD
jgi:hypothetical protein